MNDDWIFILAIILIWVATIAAGVGMVSVAGAYQCAGYEKATGKPTKYTGLECYVQDGGRWYAWSEYKLRLAAKGAM